MGYDLQLTTQNGRCAVCLRLPAKGEQRFAFDHNHETGAARGVLCAACNGGLGCFRDNPELLKAAITYLRHWASQEVEKVG
jgi:Recombination endonuclease VII.